MSRSGSFSFDADVKPRNQSQRDDEHTTPSTPGLSASQLSTPIRSHQKALEMILNTPPPGTNDCVNKNNSTSLYNNYSPDEAAAAMMPSLLPFQSQTQTPSIFSRKYDMLEPPAWKPPEEEEIEYTNAWNNTYNNQPHYLQPGLAQAQDDSTIGSSQTNNSLTNGNVNINAPNILRPRGLSLCSYTDAPSVGSFPRPQRGHAQHRRHPSLPVSFFSSNSRQGSHLLFQTEQSNQNLAAVNKQNSKSLQSTTRRTPYEPHSHHNSSQVQADAAMAGLKGVMLDLYMVDRTVDSSTARMIESKEGHSGTPKMSNNGEDKGSFKKKGAEHTTSKQKSRKTSLGTLNDIQCILELHKVDKLVDRFKQDLQMPEFFEDEACESNVWKELRRTDLEMEEHARKKKLKESKKETTTITTVRDGHGDQGKQKQIPQYHFDFSDDEDEGGWNSKETKLPGEEIYISTESLLTGHDAFQSFDPHEMEALRANTYQTSQVSASINDDLNEVIDLLRTDFEVDGASKRQSDMELIRPLLETDREMDKLKKRSQVRDMWVGDLKDLYMTDLEIDGAKRKKCAANKPQVVEETEDKSAKKVEGKPANCDSATPQDQKMPPMETTKPVTDQEVKAMLTQHIPQVSKGFCATSPELMANKTSFHGSNLHLPPPPPMCSPQPSSRSIFSEKEKANANITALPKASAPVKRSIFSRKEKSSAESKCSYKRGVMMPGTTTIVMKGGEMIDDIPVGKVVIR